MCEGIAAMCARPLKHSTICYDITLLLFEHSLTNFAGARAEREEE